MGVVFYQVWSESQWTVLLRYLINTLLSQQMLDAIKHIVDNSIVFHKILHQYVTSRGFITLGCADIATSANQHVMFMRRLYDYVRCGSCDVAIVWNFGSWTLTVVIRKWLYRDTVFYTKANSSDCPLSYRQHVVRCRCIQNSIQSNCCSAKFLASFLVSYDPITVQLLVG